MPTIESVKKYIETLEATGKEEILHYLEEVFVWGQSVVGIVLKENKVLLVRHTYGSGKGMLIIYNRRITLHW